MLKNTITNRFFFLRCGNASADDGSGIAGVLKCALLWQDYGGDCGGDFGSDCGGGCSGDLSSFLI